MGLMKCSPSRRGGPTHSAPLLLRAHLLLLLRVRGILEGSAVLLLSLLLLLMMGRHQLKELMLDRARRVLL